MCLGSLSCILQPKSCIIPNVNLGAGSDHQLAIVVKEDSDSDDGLPPISFNDQVCIKAKRLMYIRIRMGFR